MNEPEGHEPVLVKEVIRTLAPRPGQIIVDATVGHGGHALAILRQFGGEGLLIGIDRDPQMLATARRRIEAAHVPEACWRLVQADFADLAAVVARVLAECRPAAASAPDGILLDLGPSTPQLLDPLRGASWTSDAALDMRMDPTRRGPSAAELVNTWSPAELARLFREHADERWAGRIARAIVRERERAPITTGRRLGEIVAQAIPRRAWPPHTHPATRVFLALRIEVNRELEALEAVLPQAFDLLAPGGRLAVISFHSGEDRRVKAFMRALTEPRRAPWPLPEAAQPGPAEWVVRRAIRPDEEEIRRNPRSRSARLRVIRKRPIEAEATPPEQG